MKKLTGMFGTVFIMVLISFCLSVNLYAAGEKLPTGEDIIEKNLKATGGKDAYEKIKNNKVEINVKILANGMEFNIVTYQERPNKNYILTDMGTMGKVKSGSDGNVVWEINPFTGARILEGEERAAMLLDYSFDGPDAWKGLYKSVKTEGIEDVNGKACYKVVFTPKEGSPRTTYYDKESFLIIKTVGEVKNPQGTFEVETFLEDYKKTNGVLTPHTMKIVMMGQVFQILTIENIETNIEMPEGIFDIPEEIQKLM